MPKYKAKVKKATLFVRVKLLRGEELSERDLSMVSQRAFRGLLKPIVLKRNLLEYSGPQGICLIDFLKQSLTGYDFHYIMAQIVRLERKLTTSELPIKHLIADMRYVYINPYTKELQFIYLPLTTGSPRVVVREFMETIACHWRPEQEDDMQYAGRFISLIRGQRGYQPDQILAYIKQYDRRVAEQLRKTQTSMSGFITNKQADYYSHYGKQGMPQTDTMPQDDLETGMLPEKDEMSSAGGPLEETGLLTEEFQNGTALSGQTNASFPETEEFPQWDEETGLLDTAPFPQWNEETGLLDAEPEQKGRGDTDALPETEMFDDPNGADGSEDETGLLQGNSAGAQFGAGTARYPYLIRRSMNEKISINKPVFRIGKERSYVDCFISNNGAISRSHADIIRRGDRYFICDRNSTNKTYRNGYMVTPEDEVEIFDGDILQLANEEFEFHIF